MAVVTGINNILYLHNLSCSCVRRSGELVMLRCQEWASLRWLWARALELGAGAGGQDHLRLGGVRLLRDRQKVENEVLWEFLKMLERKHR